MNITEVQHVELEFIHSRRCTINHDNVEIECSIKAIFADFFVISFDPYKSVNSYLLGKNNSQAILTNKAIF